MTDPNPPAPATAKCPVGGPRKNPLTAPTPPADAGSAGSSLPAGSPSIDPNRPAWRPLGATHARPTVQPPLPTSSASYKTTLATKPTRRPRTGSTTLQARYPTQLPYSALAALRIAAEDTPNRSAKLSWPQAMAWLHGEPHSPVPAGVCPFLLGLMSAFAAGLPPQQRQLTRSVMSHCHRTHDGWTRVRAWEAERWLEQGVVRLVQERGGYAAAFGIIDAPGAAWAGIGLPAGVAGCVREPFEAVGRFHRATTFYGRGRAAGEAAVGLCEVWGVTAFREVLGFVRKVAAVGRRSEGGRVVAVPLVEGEAWVVRV